MSYLCHSGGCPGADMAWETIGKEFGVKTIAYSFPGHTQYGENRQVLSAAELEEGWQHVLEANKKLKRYPQGQATYIKNLLNRNWFQVKNSEAIFAIGMLVSADMVKGGTGWAVQMAIDNKKPVFVNDQIKADWLQFDYEKQMFLPMSVIPKLTKNFAGIGTRELNDNGLNVIAQVFENTLSGGEEEQQTRFPVTEKIAGAAPVTPAT